MALKLLIVAGEASADLHASRLLAEIRKRVTDVEAYGVGGSALAAEGMELCVNSEALNVVGTTDWIGRLAEVLGSFRKVVSLSAQRRPDAAVLLDLPDFNLRLARRLKAAGVPVIYYISPQVWAWRRYRVHTIRRNVDRLIVVFPFEREFYGRYGMDAAFLGHPLLETLDAKKQLRAPEAIGSAPRVAVLPGSRLSELTFHAPILRELLPRLRARYPEGDFLVPVAPTLSVDKVREAVGLPWVRYERRPAREAYHWADAALVASGTATLEAALVGVPFCLYYRMSRLSGFMVRHLFRYRGFFGMPNLLLGREVAREFFHERATVENLLAESVRLLEDGPYRTSVADGLKTCRERLGSPGASARVAEEILRFLDSRPAEGSAREIAPVPC